MSLSASDDPPVGDYAAKVFTIQRMKEKVTSTGTEEFIEFLEELLGKVRYMTSRELADSVIENAFQQLDKPWNISEEA